MPEHAPRGFTPWPKLLLVLLALTTSAHAQSLDLDPAPDFPTLSTTSLDRIEQSLRPEIAQLEQSRHPEGSPKAVIDSARRALRRVVLEIAQRSREDTPSALVLDMHAQRLSASIRGLDATMALLEVPSTFTGNPPQLLTDRLRQDALGALERFAAGSLELVRRSRMDTINEVDATLATALAPLVQVISNIEHITPIDRWPNRNDIATGLRTHPVRIDPITGTSIVAEADQHLAMAQRRPERAAAARDLRTLLHAAEKGPDLLEHAGFNAETIAMLGDRVDQGARRAIQEQDWDEAVVSLRTACAAQQAAQAIVGLRESSASRRADPTVFMNALEAALAVEDARESMVLLERVRGIVELLENATDQDQVMRELSTALRKVQERRRRLERQLMERVPDLAEDPRALSDPDLASLIASMRDSHDDEARIHDAQLQIQRLTALRPSATRAFTRRVRTWCRMLGEDGNRAAGAEALDAISHSFARYVPMPFEDRLSNPEEATIALTGGGAVELSRRMDLLRTAWADEIAQGVLDGPGAHALEQLARLGSMLEDLQAVAEDQQRIREAMAVMNRWGAWYLPADAIEWTARSIAPGLKVAVSDALSEDVDQLQRGLDRLDTQAPPARLLGWLSRRLAGPLDGTIGGSSGRLITSALPPGNDAWLLEDRTRLAAICRALREFEHARSTGRNEDAEKLEAFLIRTSRLLNADLGASDQ